MAAPFSQTLRSLRADSPVAAQAAWAVATAVLAAWALWFALGSVTVYEVSRRARLEVRKAPHALDAQTAGRVEAWHLALGREVREGEILVSLDRDRERLRLGEEQSRLEALAGRISALKREIAARLRARDEDVEAAAAALEVARARSEEAEVTLEFARGAEQRMARLLATGGGARVEGLRATAEAQRLGANLVALRAEARRIERDARSRDSQNEAQVETLRHALASLEGERGSAEAAVARLLADMDRHVVRAPIAGRLADVAAHRVGSYVGEGQRLATILPADDLLVVAEFEPSLALGRVRPGQRAQLRLDGFPWAQYGTVPARVATVAGEIRDGRLRVELALDGAAPEGVLLQHGLPGAVEVALEDVSPARLVLRSAGFVLAGRSGAAQP